MSQKLTDHANKNSKDLNNVICRLREYVSTYILCVHTCTRTHTHSKPREVQLVINGENCVTFEDCS